MLSRNAHRRGLEQHWLPPTPVWGGSIAMYEAAVYWFKSAARYGDSNAPATLRHLGESVPESIRLAKHR
jgi:hypothetical protein